MHPRPAHLIRLASAATMAALLVAFAPQAVGAAGQGPPKAGPAELVLDSDVYNIAEDEGFLDVTVERSGDTTSAVSVTYTASDGTAEDVTDYTGGDGMLEFQAGELSKVFQVAMVQNGTFEPDETLSLALSAPTGGAFVGDPGNATVTIADDDQPILSFKGTTQPATENAGTVHLQVSRAGDPNVAIGATVSVTGGTASAADYVAPDPTVALASGEITGTVDLGLVDDGNAEPSETVELTLSTPTGGAALGTLVTRIVTIAPSDQRPDALISLRADSGYIGNGTYNTTGAGQTKQVSAHPGDTSVFFVRVVNDGNVRNTFALRGSPPPSGTSVRYFLGTTATNVTSAMRSAAGLPATLGVGALRLIRVEITLKAGAVPGTTKRVLVGATWTGDGTRVDVARSAVRVVR